LNRPTLAGFDPTADKSATALHQYTAYGKTFNYETLVRYAQPYLAKANDLFLRNLQALREMKSSPITIKIEQAGQVNVGEKQLNVSTKSSDHSRQEPEDARAAECVASVEDSETGSLGRTQR